MSDLRDRLEVLAEEGTPRGATRVLADARTVTQTRADNTMLRRRRPTETRWVAVGAFVFAIGVVASIAIIRDATDTPTRDATRVSHAASRGTALTAGQLRAHLGRDVPAGWVPVDAGKVRVFVPPDWAVATSSGDCLVDRPGVVMIGDWTKVSQCPTIPAGQAPRAEVWIAPSTTAPSGPAVKVVHGYRLYILPPAESAVAGSVAYEIPQLGITLALNATQADTIIATLAPSARTVALIYATRQAPNGHHITTDGVRLSLPRSWIVTTPNTFPCYGFPYSTTTPELVRITSDALVPSCPPPLYFTAATQQRDGVSIETSARVGTLAGNPILVINHHATTVQIYDVGGAANVFDVYVARAHSSTHHALTVGLGLDGRVAGGIIASLEATR
jgi:hypothetical protein